MLCVEPKICVEPEISLVQSHNEWDPLEEVIVGIVDGATIPGMSPSVRVTMPSRYHQFFSENRGKTFQNVDPELCYKAQIELDGFAQTLERLGVTVQRPASRDHSVKYSTPHWESTGSYATMPRDSLIVIGDQIIEAPMSWKSRYYETLAFRPLLKKYFQAGARWVAAPKPTIEDALFLHDGSMEQPWVLSEFEPVFDAADFFRCGRDIFVQRSHVTNLSGIEWMRRHLGNEYRVHMIQFDDPTAMHIDVNFLPLCPGKALANPERVPEIPEMFRDWEILYPPVPNLADDHELYMSSRWVAINILMLDPNTVIVEQEEPELQTFLRNQGFDVVPVPFRNFCAFGGSFHCATLDIRRNGTLESIF